MIDYIDFRADKKIKEAMLSHKDDIRRMLDEQRNESHMQIEYHFRDMSQKMWGNYPYANPY